MILSITEFLQYVAQTLDMLGLTPVLIGTAVILSALVVWRDFKRTF